VSRRGTINSFTSSAWLPSCPEAEEPLLRDRVSRSRARAKNGRDPGLSPQSPKAHHLPAIRAEVGVVEGKAPPCLAVERVSPHAPSHWAFAGVGPPTAPARMPSSRFPRAAAVADAEEWRSLHGDRPSKRTILGSGGQVNRLEIRPLAPEPVAVFATHRSLPREAPA